MESTFPTCPSRTIPQCSSSERTLTSDATTHFGPRPRLVYARARPGTVITEVLLDFRVLVSAEGTFVLAGVEEGDGQGLHIAVAV